MSFNFIAEVTILSDFGAQGNNMSLLPLFALLFSDQMFVFYFFSLVHSSSQLFLKSCDQLISHVHLFATPWTIAHQTQTLSMGFLGKNTGVGAISFFNGFEVLLCASYHCKLGAYSTEKNPWFLSFSWRETDTF